MIKINGNANCEKKRGKHYRMFQNRIYVGGQNFLGAGEVVPDLGNKISGAGDPPLEMYFQGWVGCYSNFMSFVATGQFLIRP